MRDFCLFTDGGIWNVTFFIHSHTSGEERDYMLFIDSCKLDILFG